MNSIIIPTDLKNLIISFVETCKICEQIGNNIPSVVKYFRDAQYELYYVPIDDLCEDCACTNYHKKH